MIIVNLFIYVDTKMLRRKSIFSLHKTFLLLYIYFM